MPFTPADYPAGGLQKEKQKHAQGAVSLPASRYAPGTRGNKRL
jgi:hypothetical protein